MTLTNFVRRKFISTAALSACAAVLAGCSGLFGGNANAQSGKKFNVSKTTAQWKKQLTSAEYNVLREAGTERAFTSPLNKEKRSGTYACAGCGQHVYSSKTKFESGTGWPSFWESLPGKIGRSTDNKLVYSRTEVHCGRCGGHLGHIFNDGPKPTGKRHCLNGIALDFIPA